MPNSKPPFWTSSRHSVAMTDLFVKRTHPIGAMQGGKTAINPSPPLFPHPLSQIIFGSQSQHSSSRITRHLLPRASAVIHDLGHQWVWWRQPFAPLTPTPGRPIAATVGEVRPPGHPPGQRPSWASCMICHLSILHMPLDGAIAHGNAASLIQSVTLVVHGAAKFMLAGLPEASNVHYGPASEGGHGRLGHQPQGAGGRSLGYMDWCVMGPWVAS